MTALRLIAIAALPLVALAACVPAPAPTPAPSPTIAPQPTPSPTATQLPTSVYDNWIDAPQTPGNWSYTQPTTRAAFGPNPNEPLFSIQCRRSAGSVILQRSHSANVPLPASMQIYTETLNRRFDTIPGFSGTEVHVAIPADDAFLDAIAFSYGRFAVEVPGTPTLFLPAWPEISRVIDDCR